MAVKRVRVRVEKDADVFGQKRGKVCFSFVPLFRFLLPFVRSFLVSLFFSLSRAYAKPVRINSVGNKTYGRKSRKMQYALIA